MTLIAVPWFVLQTTGSPVKTVVQERVDMSMRGRVFGLSGVTFIAMPLGVLGSGFLLQSAGLRSTLMLQAVAVLALAIALSFLPVLRAIEPVTSLEEAEVTPV